MSDVEKLRQAFEEDFLGEPLREWNGIGYCPVCRDAQALLIVLGYADHVWVIHDTPQDDEHGKTYPYP